MSIDFVGDCLKCRGLSGPPVFELLPPPTPPTLSDILDDDDNNVDHTSAPFVDLNVLFKCKLHNPIKTLTHHIVTTTHDHDHMDTASNGAGVDGQPFLNLNNFLIFAIIAFVFAIILVVVILFIVNFYRNKLLKNESYLRSIRSITSTNSSSCTNSTNTSNNDFGKAALEASSTALFHQLLPSPSNDDYFYYYQRVYTEINDDPVGLTTRPTLVQMPTNGHAITSNSTFKMPVLNQSPMHFNFQT